MALNRPQACDMSGDLGLRGDKTVIRDNVSVAEAPSYGKTIYEYKPKSKGAEDYLALSREIIKREEPHE